MRKEKKEQEVRKNHKFLNLLSGIIVGMFICVTIYLIFNISKLSGIENLIRYILMIVLGIVCVLSIIKYLLLRKKGKIGKYIMFILVLLIIGAGEFLISDIIGRGVTVIDKMNKDEITYKSSLITLKSGNYDTIKKLKEGKIAIISDKEDLEGYILAQEIIKKNKITEDMLIEYDDYITMLSDLYDENIDGAFVSGSYVDKFSTMDKFVEIKNEVTELDSYSKVMKKQVDETTQVSSKSVTEPFTLLLLGVDSDQEDISKTSGLGDTIMLITFNPNTLNATVFSIPRDTYVPISCFGNYKNKITHAAAGGDSCMIRTVENFTGIDIDYYAKINFRGLINLVNALGGIDVEVPYAFCETTLWRSEQYMVYVDKGWQHLNGDQALGLARNRKTYKSCGAKWNQGTRSDFVRGQNQQLVINAIINKAKTIKSVNKLYEVLDTISINLDTNLTKEQILDFYNVFKKILLNSDSLGDKNNLINIQKTYLNGSSAMIYDKRSGLVLYNFVPSSSSLNAIKDAMKINLGLKEEKYDKSFSFSIDTPYKDKIIGMDKTGGASVALLPDFTGKTKNYVSSYCIAKGIQCTFTQQDVSSSQGYNQDQVISQSLPSSYNLEDISGTLTVTVANIKEDEKTDKEDDDKEDDDKDNDNKEPEKTCGENEEPSADNSICVCKPGYESKNGVCVKKQLSCGENEEPSADNSICLCKSGYEKVNGVCTLKSTPPATPTPDENTTTE